MWKIKCIYFAIQDEMNKIKKSRNCTMKHDTKKDVQKLIRYKYKVKVTWHFTDSLSIDGFDRFSDLITKFVIIYYVIKLEYESY